MSRPRSASIPQTVFLLLSLLVHGALLFLPGARPEKSGEGMLLVTLRPLAVSVSEIEAAGLKPPQPINPPRQKPPEESRPQAKPVVTTVPEHSPQPVPQTVVEPQPVPEADPLRPALTSAPPSMSSREAKSELTNASAPSPEPATVSTEPDKTLASGSSNEGDPLSPIVADFGSDNGPRVVEMPPPEYPRRARRLHLEGRVLIRLELDRRGNLLEARIEKSAGKSLDRAALTAVRRARFAPARRNHLPVSCVALLPIDFQLK